MRASWILVCSESGYCAQGYHLTRPCGQSRNMNAKAKHNRLTINSIMALTSAPLYQSTVRR